MPALRRIAAPLIACGLTLVTCAAASATVLTSVVRTPTDPTYLPVNEAPFGTGGAALTVEGTTTTDDGNAADKVELACFYTTSAGTASKQSLATLKGTTAILTVKPDGSFSTAGLSGEERISLESVTFEQPCTLRAVPPGTAATESLAPFTGPRLGDSEYTASEQVSGGVYDFYTQATTLEGYWGWDGAGSCGPYGRVFDPFTFRASVPRYIADCEGNLYRENETRTAASIVIDGHNAYTSYAQHSTGESIEGIKLISGEHHEYDPSTGAIAQTWTETLQRCEGALGQPVDELSPTTTTCKKFVPTGVQLVRSISTGAGGLVATVADRFQSTDGAPHTVTLDYGEEDNGSEEKPAYKFPGETAFTERKLGATAPTGSIAPETIFFEANTAAKEPAGSLAGPIGAITLSAVPDAVRFGSNNYFELEYRNRTVPAGGALALTAVLSQAITLARAQQLAAAGEDALAGPAVAITAPANGTTVTSPTLGVSGTATDNFGVAALTLDGVPVAYGGSGAWTGTVTLKPGVNTVSALATDHAGNTAAASISVTYTPPARASVRRLRASGTSVIVSLACTGAAGTKCTVLGTLTTLEKLSHGKLRAIAARLRSKTVVVGSRRVTLAAGAQATLTIKLNATGRRLLARFHRLPLKALVQLLEEGGKKKVRLSSATLTLKPKHRTRRHR